MCSSGSRRRSEALRARPGDDPHEGDRARAEERRLANFLDFIGEGRGSQALGEALVETERRVEALREELDGLRRGLREGLPGAPGRVDRGAAEPAAGDSRAQNGEVGLLLRRLLGPIRFEPTKRDIRESLLRRTELYRHPGASRRFNRSRAPDDGSNSLRWWRRRESNPRPKTFLRSFYMLSRIPSISPPPVRTRQDLTGAIPFVSSPVRGEASDQPVLVDALSGTNRREPEGRSRCLSG